MQLAKLSPRSTKQNWRIPCARWMPAQKIWHGGGESFLDAFKTNLVQLNDSRDTPVDEKQVCDWLCYCLQGHPAAVVSIHQQHELEIFQQETTPGYVRPFSNFMNGLCISLQQYDDEHKPKQNTNHRGHGNDNADRQANTMQQSPEDFEWFRNEMKELGMWLEGDAYKAMKPSQQKAHKEKIKVIRQQKRITQANVGQIIPTTLQQIPLHQILKQHHRLLLKWPLSQLITSQASLW
jgi:hypothetical protein